MNIYRFADDGIALDRTSLALSHIYICWWFPISIAMTDGTAPSAEPKDDTAHLNTPHEYSSQSFAHIVLDPAIVADSWETIRGYLPDSVKAKHFAPSGHGDKENARPAAERDQKPDAFKNGGLTKGKASLEAWDLIKRNVLRVHQAKGINSTASTAKEQNTSNVAATPFAKPASDLNVITYSTDHHAPTSEERESPSIILDCRRPLVEHSIVTHDHASGLRGDFGLASEESRMSVGSDVEVGRELGSALSMLDVAERAVTRPSGATGDIVVNSGPTGEWLASLKRYS